LLYTHGFFHILWRPADIGRVRRRQLLAVRLCAALLPTASPDGRRERFADPNPPFLADLTRYAAGTAATKAGGAYEAAVQSGALGLLVRMLAAGYYADVRMRVEAAEALPQMDR
jgi:hypothetical protein